MPRELKPCGTTAAYARHRWNHEEPCDACKKAQAEQGAAYRAKNPAKARAATRRYYARQQRGEQVHVDPCGTVGAYRAHFRNQEEPCDACRAANTQYERARKAAKRAEASQ